MNEKITSLLKEAGVTNRDVLVAILVIIAEEVGEDSIADKLNEVLGLEVEEQDILFLISNIL